LAESDKRHAADVAAQAEQKDYYSKLVALEVSAKREIFADKNAAEIQVSKLAKQLEQAKQAKAAQKDHMDKMLKQCAADLDREQKLRVATKIHERKATAELVKTAKMMHNVELVTKRLEAALSAGEEKTKALETELGNRKAAAEQRELLLSGEAKTLSTVKEDGELEALVKFHIDALAALEKEKLTRKLKAVHLCPICQEKPLDCVIFDCMHTTCWDCCKKWKDLGKTCPNCRQPIKDFKKFFLGV
jgi:hypothetical protein